MASEPFSSRILLAANLPVEPLLRMTEGAKSLSAQAAELREELYRPLLTNTPYGTLRQTLDLDNEDGERLTIEFVHPMAMLHLMTEKSEVCGRFFKEQLCPGPAHVVLYIDETRPGNQLRPDSARSMHCIYWTFSELPTWFRARPDVGWFPFAFVPTEVASAISGGVSALMAAVAKVFFSSEGDSPNLHRVGIRLFCGDERCHLRAVFGCFLGDERAIKEVVSCKGASGTKPCCCCKNVLGRTQDIQEGGYLIHFKASDCTRFDLHTTASFEEMADQLELAAGGPSRAFSRLEQILGLTYHPKAILWDRAIRGTLSSPTSVFWDWMHCIVASGGIAQYEVNQLVLAAVGKGITIDRLDTFTGTITFPHGSSPLPRHFFRDRIMDGDTSHLKAFAAETLVAVTVLGLFCDSVLKPTGALRDHTSCLDHLRVALDILSSGSAHKVGELQRAIRQHHELFVRIYPGCVKPKLHYLTHIPACIERLGCVLSCFAPERKHHSVKVVATHAFRQWNSTILARQVYTLMDRCERPQSFQPCFLTRPRPLAGTAGVFSSWGVTGDVISSVSMQTHLGVLRRGDLLCWEHSGRNNVGLAKFFLQLDRGHQPVFAVFVHTYAHIRGPIYSSERPVPTFLTIDLVKSVRAFWTEAGSVWVVLPPST